MSGALGVHDQREAEVAGQCLADRRPGIAAVVAAVHTPVVLQEQHPRTARVSIHLVHALAEFGWLGIGQEWCGDAAVAGLPGVLAVLAAVHAAGGDGDQHPLLVSGVRQDGMQAQPAAARLPLRSVRMVPQAADQGERLIETGRTEQRGGFHAGVDRLADGPDLPDPPQGRPGVGRKSQLWHGGLDEGGAEVVGPQHGRAPVLTESAGQQPWSARLWLPCQRVHRLARQ